MSVIESVDRGAVTRPFRGIFEWFVARRIEVRRRRAEARVHASLEEMNPHFLRDIGLYRDPVGQLYSIEALAACDLRSARRAD